MMIELVVVLTLCCLFLPLYSYAVYPALLWMLVRLGMGRQRTEWEHLGDSDLPSVTLIISCFNEADVIQRKLENALALDYPSDRLSIMIVSDASDDGTDEVVSELCEARGETVTPAIKLIRQPRRQGKTAGLNAAMARIKSDLTVFSDANALYARDAIRALISPFSDAAVGYTVGAAIYTDGSQNAAAASENRYWSYELAIKRWESQLHSVVGGDGAIYAIRSRLWQPLSHRDINDFVNPLQIIALGYFGVFVPQAQCFEESAGDFSREASRKERIVNRSIRGLFRVPAVMNPLRSGWFSWQVISHKLLRWLLPVFAGLGLFGSVVLSLSGLWQFQVLTMLAFIVLTLALLGGLLRHWVHCPFWLSLPFYLVLVNLSALRGIWTACRGHTQVTWQTVRTSTPEGRGSVSGSPLLHVLATLRAENGVMLLLALLLVVLSSTLMISLGASSV